MTTRRPLNICIATSDIVGPVRNGGIGTWYHALATALADAGHHVTVLYCLGQWCENHTLDHWTDHYRQRGIEFVPLPEYGRGVLECALWVRTSYVIYEWLKEREQNGCKYDVIHFHEWRGHGCFSALAKKQGLAFKESVICVGTHSPLLWHKYGMAEFIAEFDELQTDFLERQSVALADVVVSPSVYMIQWITSQGWRLPNRVEIRQYIQSHYLPRETFNWLPPHATKEFVFFGRLETRKGIALFCDAVDRLANWPGIGVPREGALTETPAAPDAPSDSPVDEEKDESQPAVDDRCPLRITFLGKCSSVNGVDARQYIDQRSKNWPFYVQIVDDRDHAGAIEYLRGPNRTGVICSLLENSPNTVLECLVNQVPMLCTNIGGNCELIAEEDRMRITFDPRPPALAEKLAMALLHPFAAARPAIYPEETKRLWLEWHDQIVEQIPAVTVRANVNQQPKVSLCICHRNRPQLLKYAIESARAQDYPNLELVLVDDGSTNEDALAFLRELEPEFGQRGWQIVRQPNKYLGAARNNAARHATGEYLLFMDDDNYAKPHEVSTFVKAAIHSGADILTCPLDVFHGFEGPGEQGPNIRRWVPLGGSAVTGVFTNLFGDANALIRKSAFQALGGFTEDYGVGHEDWELFAKAVLAGYTVQVVPECLFWYRVDQTSMLRTTNHFANHMRSLRPYLNALPADLRQILEYAQGLFVNWSKEYMAKRAVEAAAATPTSTPQPEPPPAPAPPPEPPGGLSPAPEPPPGQEAVATPPAQPAPEAAPAVASAVIEVNAAESFPQGTDIAANAATLQFAVDSHSGDNGGAMVDSNGEPAVYQQVVDEYWNSLSWRISSPFRNAMLLVQGRSPARRPHVETAVEAQRVVETIQHSFSWEVAGPLRAVGRVVKRLGGK
jgi:glycosyltransferase involved in cell wall biosynthesis